VNQRLAAGDGLVLLTCPSNAKKNRLIEILHCDIVKVNHFRPMIAKFCCLMSKLQTSQKIKMIGWNGEFQPIH